MTDPGIIFDLQRRASAAAELTAATMANVVSGSVEVSAQASSVFMKEAIETAIATGHTGVQRYARAFSKSLEQRFSRSRSGRRRRIHIVAGERALHAAHAEYFSTRRPTTGRLPRPDGSRFEGGILGRALRSEQMYVATEDGISFINRTFLDSQAAQWQRLNYGAGSRGTGTRSPRDHRIRFFDATAGYLSLPGRGPSPGFDLPAGRWGFDDSRHTGFPFIRRGEPFRPAYLPEFQGPRAVKFYKARPTQGIRGDMFLDVGVRELAKSLGDGYTILMNEWFEEAAKQRTGPVAGLLDQDELVRATEILRSRTRINERTLREFKSRMTPLQSGSL